MLAAAAAAGVAHALTGDARLHWLALHGGVSQLVLGPGQFFLRRVRASPDRGPARRGRRSAADADGV
jgi:hypothetical protein